jgi:hypothetical protein
LQQLLSTEVGEGKQGLPLPIFVGTKWPFNIDKEGRPIRKWVLESVGTIMEGL